MSFKEPTPRTNPYITQLRDSLAETEGVTPSPWTWKGALTGPVDVFHAHWPESLIEQRGAVSTLGRRVLYALFLLRLQLTGVPVVRTVHNVDLPQGISRVDRSLLRWTERLTRVRIVLNEFTPVPADQPSVLIEHGDYRRWFAKYDVPDPVAGRVVFFGKIRRYKNVEGLIEAFTAIEDRPDWTLRVVGSPSSDELAGRLRELAQADPRIGLELGFVEDPDLAREAGEATVVVLPYPEMHNSGSVLAALSFDRPVLVPDNAFNRALDAEVGPGWVLRYEGDLTAADVEAAVLKAQQGGGRPDLDRRDWSQAGPRHVAAYRLALEG
nr:glycosyltransferase [Aeromicrobium duanguangcaii]